MTASAGDLLLYAGALFLLFLTPGPVWLALMARTVSGGFAAAWPLALGVTIGDMVWSLAAIIGVSWIVSEVESFMILLRYGASVMFLGLGWGVIRQAGHKIAENRRLTQPGKAAGFLAGMAVSLGNPKGILFYMGVLPGFFDLTHITGIDIAAITTLSFMVPLLGNLGLALFVARMRGFASDPVTLRKLNLGAGGLLICVGLIIPFT